MQFPQYNADRGEVVKRALDAGVGMVCVGTDLENSHHASTLADAYNDAWAAVGIHPNEVPSTEHRAVSAEFKEMLQHPKVVAIGEVGLDYYRTTAPEAQACQREAFAQFIALAKQHHKPLIVHCRDPISSPQASYGTSAYDDLLTFDVPRGVIHSFNGTPEQAKEFLKRGLYIGLNAIATFSASYREMVRLIPADRLLLETDAPYLAPEPHRGKRNEPLYVLDIAHKIAEIRAEDEKTLCENSVRNAISLFNLA